MIRPRSGVEPLLLRQHGVLLDPVPQSQQSRKCIRKREDEQRPNEPRDERELRNRGANDKGNGPVNRHEASPEPLASLDGQRREVEDLLEKLHVDNLEANVAVERGGNERGDENDDVADRLPGEGGESLMGRVEGELSLSDWLATPSRNLSREKEAHT